jgi:hypothetical protein
MSSTDTTTAISFSSFSYSFIAYIFVCIVLGLGTTMMLMQSARPIAGVICLILFIFIFIFYGRRWFGKNLTGSYSGTWPPIINMCPDYLLYFKRTVGGKPVDTCVDLVGVNRSATALRPWIKGDSPENPPADDAKYFMYVYKAGMNSSDIQKLCDAAQQAGLTWEGITNGESCTYNPPSQVLGSNSVTSPTTCAPTLK